MIWFIIGLIAGAYLLLYVVNQLRARRRAQLREMEEAEAVNMHAFGQY